MNTSRTDALSYEWLAANGFHCLERFERQPTDHYRRCIGLETAERGFLVAREDLCIDIAPERMPDPAFWFCWLTRASSQHQHPSVWIHVRHIKTVGDLILLYQGFTGRKFGQPAYRISDLQPLINSGKAHY